MMRRLSVIKMIYLYKDRPKHNENDDKFGGSGDYPRDAWETL